MTAILESYEKRMTKLQVTLIMKQELWFTDMQARFRSMISKMWSELSDAWKEITELMRSFVFVQEETEDIRKVIKTQSSAVLKVTAERVTDLEKKIMKIDDHVDYLDDHSHRNNIHIDGITEAKGETWDMSEDRCHKLELDWTTSLN